MGRLAKLPGVPYDLRKNREGGGRNEGYSGTNTHLYSEGHTWRWRCGAKKYEFEFPSQTSLSREFSEVNDFVSDPHMGP